MEWIVVIAFWCTAFYVAEKTPVDKWNTVWKITYGNVCGCILAVILRYL